MTDRYDVVILGAGPAGEVAANTLNRAGRRVALIEPELIGGECSNWGCIPSKTLLRAPDLKGQGGRAAGVAEPALDFADVAAYRDYMVSYHDDAGKVARLEESGVTVLKAPGRLAGPGRVEAGGRLLETEAVILATGAEAVIPPLPGLAEAGYWTNREAIWASAVPSSLVVLGGGNAGYAAAFRAHPYSWPIIGWMKDIESTTLDDIIGHYRLYYRPNNAVVVIAGNVDPADAIARGIGDQAIITHVTRLLDELHTGVSAGLPSSTASTFARPANVHQALAPLSLKPPEQTLATLAL